MIKKSELGKEIERQNTPKWENEVQHWKIIRQMLEKTLDEVRLKEQRAIEECKYYEWNIEAQDEYCLNPNLNPERDFISIDECWKCKFRKER